MSLLKIKAEGCLALEDLQFGDSSRTEIKKGSLLKNLFYRKITKDYVMFYDSWYVLPAKAVDATNRTFPDKDKK